MTTLTAELAGAAQFARAVQDAKQQKRPTIQLRMILQLYDYKKQRYSLLRGTSRGFTLKALPGQAVELDAALRCLVALIHLRGISAVRQLLAAALQETR